MGFADGCPMAFPAFSPGCRMVFPFFHWFPVALPWFSHGFPMVESLAHLHRNYASFVVTQIGQDSIAQNPQHASAIGGEN